MPKLKNPLVSSVEPDNGSVRVYFDKPREDLDLTPEEAEDLAGKLWACARRVRQEIL